MVLGYVVLQINRSTLDYPIGFIVDFLGVPGEENAVSMLIKESMNFFHNDGVNIVTCQIVKGHVYEGILNQNGFINSRISTHLFIKPYNPVDHVLGLVNEDPSSIYFNYSDIDSLPSRLPISR